MALQKARESNRISIHEKGMWTLRVCASAGPCTESSPLHGKPRSASVLGEYLEIIFQSSLLYHQNTSTGEDTLSRCQQEGAIGTVLVTGGDLAQREASGVDVHLGETQVFERRGQGEGSLHGDVAQQVGLLAALLQLVRGVVQHLFVTVAHLLHLEPVDLPTQTDQLPGQAVVLDLHVSL